MPLNFWFINTKLKTESVPPHGSCFTFDAKGARESYLSLFSFGSFLFFSISVWIHLFHHKFSQANFRLVFLFSLIYHPISSFFFSNFRLNRCFVSSTHGNFYIMGFHEIRFCLLANLCLSIFQINFISLFASVITVLIAFRLSALEFADFEINLYRVSFSGFKLVGIKVSSSLIHWFRC